MRTILITGATGLIGGRLAEIACERGLQVTALVRTWSHAARLSRLPARLVHGDILDATALEAAMRGCDVVFHCAVDGNTTGEEHRRISVDGTVNVLRAAHATGMKRVVHLSSTAVFGYRPAPDAASEAGAYHYTGDDYCDSKIDSEKEALRFCRELGLPVTVLRPTIVYGPFSFWSRDTIQAVRQGRMVLVDGAAGVCNSLYVDNLIEVMLVAGVCEQAVGEVFHISDAKPLTWRAFIEAHARIVGAAVLPLPEMRLQEVAATWPPLTAPRRSSLAQTLRLVRAPGSREALRSIPVVDQSARAAKGLARVLLPAAGRRWLRQRVLPRTDSDPAAPAAGSVRGLLTREEVGMYTTFDQVVFSIDKARRMLDYAPALDFAAGMARTAAWAEWARL